MNFKTLIGWLGGKKMSPNFRISDSTWYDMRFTNLLRFHGSFKISFFFVSGKVISERRSQFTAELIQLCIYVKDYLDNVERIQHRVSLEWPYRIHVEEVALDISPLLTEVENSELNWKKRWYLNRDYHLEYYNSYYFHFDAYVFM